MFINFVFIIKHFVLDVDDAYPASSSSTRQRTPAWAEGPCPGLGSAGLVLGCATFWWAQLSEEPARRRPGASLVAVTWACIDEEASVSRAGGSTPCHGGERARPALLGCVGEQPVLQYLVDSLGISPELWSGDSSFSLGVHRGPLNLEELLFEMY